MAWAITMTSCSQSCFRVSRMFPTRHDRSRTLYHSRHVSVFFSLSDRVDIFYSGNSILFPTSHDRSRRCADCWWVLFEPHVLIPFPGHVFLRSHLRGGRSCDPRRCFSCKSVVLGGHSSRPMLLHPTRHVPKNLSGVAGSLPSEPSFPRRSFTCAL